MLFAASEKGSCNISFALILFFLIIAALAIVMLKSVHLNIWSGVMSKLPF